MTKKIFIINFIVLILLSLFFINCSAAGSSDINISNSTWKIAKSVEKSIGEFKGISIVILYIREQCENKITYLSSNYYDESTEEYKRAKLLYDGTKKNFNEWINIIQNKLMSIITNELKEEDENNLSDLLEKAFKSSNELIAYVSSLEGVSALGSGESSGFWSFAADEINKTTDRIKHSSDEVINKQNNQNELILKELKKDLMDLHNYLDEIRFDEFENIYNKK